MSTAAITPHLLNGPTGLLWLFTWLSALVVSIALPHGRRAGAVQQDRGSGALLVIGVVLGTIMLVACRQIAPAADIAPPATAFAAGEAVFLVGFALRLWAMRTLGQYFTDTVMTSPDQPVIATGPYRLLRHPSYTGALLCMAGVGLVWENWLGLAVVTLLTLVPLIYRIRVEERALRGAIGEYGAYAAHHKRMVPLVW